MRRIVKTLVFAAIYSEQAVGGTVPPRACVLLNPQHSERILMRTLILSILQATLLYATALASAHAFYDSFGPAPGHHNVDRFNVGYYPGSGTDQLVGFQYTSTASGEVDYYEMALVADSLYEPPSVTFTVTLHSDADGGVGDELDRIKLWVGGPFTKQSIVRGDSSYRPTLTKGEKYWIVVRGRNSQSRIQVKDRLK
ncbi:MAG: hypothetical protein AB8B93_17565 [Pseudomonadales bacterium]